MFNLSPDGIYLILDTRYWILDTGYSILDTGYSILDGKIDSAACFEI